MTTTRRTYWQGFPRNFANEYEIGIATTGEAAAQYRAEGYDRINRETALRELSYQGDNATQVYCYVTIDHEQSTDDQTSVAMWLRTPKVA